MSEEKGTLKLPKRIRLGKLPYVVGIGGTKESKDMKLMFIEKAMNKHYTFRIMADQENGRLVFEMHATDEEKKYKLIQEGKATKEAYVPFIRMILDFRALERDSEKMGTGIADLASKIAVAVESDEIFKDKAIIPISRDNGLFEERKSGKEVYIDDEKLMALVSNIHGVEDLDKNSFVAGIVRGESRHAWGCVFKKDGKWYYMDMLEYTRKVLLLLEPYITIESKIIKGGLSGA